MTLVAGARLGPYEVLGPLGAGGMGEVYRARDTRLSREVAIKVLPAELSSDVSRLKRFENEARSASGLNHPNIVTVYDIGSENGLLYIGMERVAGETLRKLLLNGALPVKRLLGVATQIAEGLAKAHEAGIVHRDLKPENLMVTKDGLVKILDFGLAKPAHVGSGSDEGSRLPTETGSSPGMIVGTVGYMSPEQASREAIDFRSDQFAFGSIVYEMATGERAFHKRTGVDTLSAILNEEPQPIASASPQTPASLRWIVERCLAKDPDERYASTKDLARELATVRDHLSEATSGAIAAAPAARKRLWPWLVAAVVAACLAGAAYRVGGKKDDRPPPSFQQLTFRRGSVYSARFGTDGSTILYTAAWDGKPMEIFVGRIQSADARPFGLVGAELLSISPSGEMAVSLSRIPGPITGPVRRQGTLARLWIGGSTAPREVLEKVEWADWAPDGKSLAVIREEKLEYPLGKVLYEVPTDGWLSDPRVSPDGESVALIHHPATAADEGSVFLVDRSGAKTKLAGPFYSARGLAWGPDGDVWFTAAEVGTVGRALYSAKRTGGARLRSRIAGSMTLLDISPLGRMLVSREIGRTEIGTLAAGESRERELTWLDWSAPGNISPDGRVVLFSGPSGDLDRRGGDEPDYFVYLRKTDGSPPTRLGGGLAAALSPDGKVALAVTKASAADSDPDLIVYQTGAGEARHLPKTRLVFWGINRNCFLPDGKRFVVTAAEEGREKPRVWLRDIDGGKPIPLTPEGYGGGIVSLDGKSVLVNDLSFKSPGSKYYLCSIPGGKLREIKGLEPTDRVYQVSADGRSLYVAGSKEIPRKVYRFDLATGRKALWRTVMPADLAGVSELNVFPAPSGDSYLYSYTRSLSDLYLIEGLR